MAWDIVFPYVPQCSPLLDHNLGYMDALCAPLDPCKRGLGLPFKLSVFGLHSGWCEGVVWWKNHCGFLIFFCNTKLNPQYLLLTPPGYDAHAGPTSKRSNRFLVEGALGWSRSSALPANSFEQMYQCEIHLVK